MNLKQLFIILLCLPFLLVSCTSNFSDLKRSSGNKLFDANGYQSNKRRPLYNKKYISKAKRNVINSDYEDDDIDEDSEVENPTKKNIDMYKNMVGKKRSPNSRPNFEKKRADYIEQMNEYEDDDSSLTESRDNLSRRNSGRNREALENEIAEIKVMLQKTKDEITKAKCPYVEKPSVKTSKKKQENIYDDEEMNEYKTNNHTKLIAPPPGSMTSVAK